MYDSAMGRKVASLILICCFITALVVFFSRETKNLREAMTKTTPQESRVILEEFSMLRYEDGALEGKISARMGHFVEPNIIELEGDVQAERVNENSKESMRADAASVYLKATGLSTILNQETELDRAEFTGLVQVGIRDHILTTDYAEFLSKGRIVRSPRPVRVDGPSRYFAGDDGFTYDLTSQILEMKGQVRGVTTVNENK